MQMDVYEDENGDEVDVCVGDWNCEGVLIGLEFAKPGIVFIPLPAIRIT